MFLDYIYAFDAVRPFFPYDYTSGDAFARAAMADRIAVFNHGRRLERWILFKQGIEDSRVPKEQNAKVGLTANRNLSPWKRNRGPLIAAHCVKRGGNRC